MKSDIQIAREIPLKDIREISKQLNIDEDLIWTYGKHMAKVPYKLIDEDKVAKSNLILVTAITPTKAGIGKTTVAIGLAQGLQKIGKKGVVALREPSLGPCFGMKGGAAGGGYSQVLPMENINLHFTGDFHAITTAHNMITALLDNYLHQNKKEGKGLQEVVWKRVLDINDRNLRNIVSGLGAGNGVASESGFDITPASEIMAILCLASDIDDLRRRIEKIILGYDYDKNPFTVKDLGIAGSIVVLLKDALNPNLVQTAENTPAIIHGGPFANIAHGCNSILATKLAMSHADYVVTEAGFGADLGAEKFFNIKCRKAGLNPKLSVLVVTTRGLKLHGGALLDEISKPDIQVLKHGLKNMDKHIDNLKHFSQSVVVSLNKYASDSDEEIAFVCAHCRQNNIPCALNTAYADGGKGSIELARAVVDAIENNPSQKVSFTYNDNESIDQKITKVAQNIYGASQVKFLKKAEKKLKKIEGTPMADYPVCIAKTQYSFSSDPSLYGVPENFEIEIKEIIVNNGAEFIVAIAGDILRMPGLPKNPQALHIDYINGQIEGLS